MCMRHALSAGAQPLREGKRQQVSCRPHSNGLFGAATVHAPEEASIGHDDAHRTALAAVWPPDAWRISPRCCGGRTTSSSAAASVGRHGGSTLAANRRNPSSGRTIGLKTCYEERMKSEPRTRCSPNSSHAAAAPSLVLGPARPRWSRGPSKAICCATRGWLGRFRSLLDGHWWQLGGAQGLLCCCTGRGHVTGVICVQ